MAGDLWFAILAYRVLQKLEIFVGDFSRYLVIFSRHTGVSGSAKIGNFCG